MWYNRTERVKRREEEGLTRRSKYDTMEERQTERRTQKDNKKVCIKVLTGQANSSIIKT